MGAPGFDDAVKWVDREAAQPKPVTLVYPYYENPLFFARQIAHWNELKEALRQHVSVIVVDDGSPIAPAADVLRTVRPVVPLRLFRIGVDVRWNWLAARNIGMHYAVDGWCVLTDMDHMVPEETLTALITQEHDPAIIYRFGRREHTGAAVHPHPNSMFMTRAMFWRVGGYDETLSGHYGTDGDWRRRCAATTMIRTLTHDLVRHEYQDDSSTLTYKRKQPEDAGKKALIARRGRGWKPKTLSFPYGEVAL
jgi:hypothetical protein